MTTAKLPAPGLTAERKAQLISELNNHNAQGPLKRTFALDLRAAGALNAEKRTVQIAWASEFPEKRWFGNEILDCTPQAVRLDRLRDGGALLFNHREDDLLGVVQSASVDADHVARAEVRFDTGPDGEQRWQQVLNGVLRHVSVRYRIHDMVLEREEDDAQTYRVTDWEPYEVSFVTIPVDHSVGLGRSASLEAPPPAQATTPTPTPIPTPTPTEKGKRTMDIVKDPAAEAAEQLRQAQAAALEAKRTTDADTARRDAIIELGVQYADYLSLADVAEACRSGKTAQAVQASVMERMKTKHSDTRGAHVGLSDKEAKNFSIARAVHALCTGDWKEAGFERSVHDAASKQFSQSSRGILIPMDVFAKSVFDQRTFIAGTAAEAGNLIPTALRTDLFVDVLRNNLVLGKLGITMLYGLTSNVDIPKKITSSTLGYVTEVATLAETQPVTAKVSMSPKRIGGFIKFSKQANIQSAMALEPLLRQDVMDQYLRDIENACINGSGAGANPRGIRNTSGIGSVAGGVNGLALAWSHLVDLESACANVNSEPDTRSGYLVNTKTRGKAKQTQKAANLQFAWDNGGQPLNGYRAAVSNVMPSNLTKGSSSGICSSMLFGSDWASSVMGTFGAVELLVDELTLATTGFNQLILNAFMDHTVRRASDFASMDDLLAG